MTTASDQRVLINRLYRLAGEAMGLLVHASPEREVHLTPHGFLVLRGDPRFGPNFMMITDRAAGPARLREFAGRVNERGLPCTLWLTRDQLDHLSAEASALGFAPAGTWRLMVLDPDTVVPATSIAGLTIVSGLEAQAEMIRFLNADGVSTEQAERHFGPEFIEAPGLDLFIARNEGQPIATVTTTRGGSTVGIWAMITLDAYQRQGIGYALLAHAINHYRAGGARLFYLISTEAGARLYQKMGFQTLDEVAVWRRKSVEGVARV